MLHWTLQNDAIINLSTQFVLMHDITTFQEHPYMFFVHEYAYNDRHTVIQKI